MMMMMTQTQVLEYRQMLKDDLNDCLQDQLAENARQDAMRDIHELYKIESGQYN